MQCGLWVNVGQRDVIWCNAVQFITLGIALHIVEFMNLFKL